MGRGYAKAQSKTELASKPVIKSICVRNLGIALLVALAACSKAAVPDASKRGTAATTTQPALSYIDTEAGRYRVDLDPDIDPKLLPTNAELKMVDGDLSQYVRQLCGLNFANKMRPDRCEVFVQSDKSGLLVGYVVVQQGRDVDIDTAIETHPRQSGLGCFLNGKLEISDYKHPDAKPDISKNFSARMGYAAWEKNPGNWMVLTGDNTNNHGAKGMWYIEQVGKKLRITQENWSYCYSDPNIFIDEVFHRAATISRVSN